MSPDDIAVDEQDVFALTDKGTAELKAGGTSLSLAELELLVLLDGDAPVARVMQGTRKSLPGDVIDALRALIRKNLIKSATHSGRLDFGGVFSANPEIHGLSAAPKRFYVRIARRPAAKIDLKNGRHATVLVVDDDPDLIKLLRTYLMLEGFIAQTAQNRDELLAQFRNTPIPDLVLLDVQMPDADGFDILSKLRQHPVLKAVPVIMLTAEATRDAVLRGLRADVEGYVTKPFEPDALMSAVKAVLGLPDEPGTSPWADNYNA